MQLEAVQTSISISDEISLASTLMKPGLLGPLGSAHELITPVLALLGEQSCLPGLLVLRPPALALSPGPALSLSFYSSTVLPFVCQVHPCLPGYLILHHPSVHLSIHTTVCSFIHSSPSTHLPIHLIHCPLIYYLHS